MNTKTVTVRNAWNDPAATFPQARTTDRAIVEPDGDVLVWCDLSGFFRRSPYLTPAQIRSARARWAKL